MKPAHQNPHFNPSASETAQKTAFKKAQRRGSGLFKNSGGNKGAHSATPSIELYQKESCPFSHAVRNKLTHLGLDFVAHSVPDDQPLKHEQLVKAGGKDQLPFLIDHTSGVKLYESQAILAYLEKSYGKHATQDWLTRLTWVVDSRVRAWADPIAWRLSSPLLRAQRLQLDARNALQTLEGSWGYLRSRFQAAIDEARSKTQGTRATTDEDEETPTDVAEASPQAEGAQPLKTQKPAPHAEVLSATGSA
jgi:glutathione S-transferase